MEKYQKSVFAFLVAILFTLVGNAQNCPAPQVSLIATTSSSITIGWNQLSLTETYKVELYQASNNSLLYTDSNVTTNQFTFDGLNSNTEYLTKVYRKCGTQYSTAGSLLASTMPIINDEIIFLNKNSSSSSSKIICDASCIFEKSTTFLANQRTNLSLNANQYLVMNITDGLDRYTLKMKYDPINDRMYICKDVVVQTGNVSFNVQTIGNNNTIYVQKTVVVGTNISVQPAFTISNINGNVQLGILSFDLIFNKKFQLSSCKTNNPKSVNSGTTVQTYSDLKEGAYSIRIHPNPIQTVATVDFVLTEDSPVNLVVRNIQGHAIIMHNYALFAKGQNRIQIPTDMLQQGIYFIELITSKDRIVHKVVKQ
jgi:Secretion system C-terminal sorting domain